MTKGLTWTVAALASSALVAAAAAATTSHLPPPVLINESRSLPKGLYVRLPQGRIGAGAIVAFPQPDGARSYLQGLGMPAQVHLLKRVSAMTGERVCAGAGTVATPRRRVDVHALDRRGVALASWRACRELDSEELFLLGDSPSSFDSRYFGPVSRADVIGVYKAVLTW